MFQTIALNFIDYPFKAPEKKEQKTLVNAIFFIQFICPEKGMERGGSKDKKDLIVIYIQIQREREMGRQIKRHREIEEKYRGGQVGREKGDRLMQ